LLSSFGLGLFTAPCRELGGLAFEIDSALWFIREDEYFAWL